MVELPILPDLRSYITKSSTLNNVQAQAQLNHDLIPKNSYTPLPLHMDVDEDPKMLQYNQQKQIPYNPQPTPTIKLEGNLRGNDPMDTSSLLPHPAVPPPIHPVSREVLNLNEIATDRINIIITN